MADDLTPEVYQLGNVRSWTLNALYRHLLSMHNAHMNYRWREHSTGHLGYKSISGTVVRIRRMKYRTKIGASDGRIKLMFLLPP